LPPPLAGEAAGRAGRGSRPRSRIVAGLIAALALATISTFAAAQSVEEFYRGKTVNMIIGFSVGGGYDLYGRLVARHIGRHIRAGECRAAEHDGRRESPRRTIYLFGRAQGRHRDRHFRPHHRDHAAVDACFSAIRRHQVHLARQRNQRSLNLHYLAYLAGQDLERFPAKGNRHGGEGSGADPDVYALLYKNVFGAKFKLVAGYHGTNDIVLAMERGEVDGLCGYSWSTLKARHTEWMNEKKINIVVQAALKKQPELGNVPIAYELTQDREKLQILKLYLASQEAARPFAAPPDLPAARKAALIAAFNDTMKDAEFLADARKLNLDVNPLGASALDRIMAELYATPKSVLEKAAAAIAK